MRRPVARPGRPPLWIDNREIRKINVCYSLDTLSCSYPFSYIGSLFRCQLSHEGDGGVPRIHTKQHESYSAAGRAATGRTAFFEPVETGEGVPPELESEGATGAPAGAARCGQACGGA